ncbi:hypothetical protein EMIT079MI2_70046 [Bacillus sp. IT-79MI2]
MQVLPKELNSYIITNKYILLKTEIEVYLEKEGKIDDIHHKSINREANLHPPSFTSISRTIL